MGAERALGKVDHGLATARSPQDPVNRAILDDLERRTGLPRGHVLRAFEAAYDRFSNREAMQRVAGDLALYLYGAFDRLRSTETRDVDLLQARRATARLLWDGKPEEARAQMAAALQALRDRGVPRWIEAEAVADLASVDAALLDHAAAAAGYEASARLDASVPTRVRGLLFDAAEQLQWASGVVDGDAELRRAEALLAEAQALATPGDDHWIDIEVERIDVARQRLAYIDDAAAAETDLLARARLLVAANEKRAGQATLLRARGAIAALSYRRAGRLQDAAAFAAAAEDYRLALDGRDRKRGPVFWSMLQQRRGAMLRRGCVVGRDVELCRQAIVALETALGERARGQRPYEWAETRIEIGAAMVELADRGAGRGFDEAAAQFRATREVVTRERSPEWHADLGFRLAYALRRQGRASGDEAVLRECVTVANEAAAGLTLEEAPATLADMRYEAGVCQHALARPARDIAGLEAAERLLREALAAYERGPRGDAWAWTHVEIARVLRDRGLTQKDVVALRAAAQQQRQALTVWTRARDFQRWYDGSHDLVLILIDVANRSDAPSDWREAETVAVALRAAEPADSGPLDRAALRYNLGLIGLRFGIATESAPKLLAAVADFGEAQQYYSRGERPLDWDDVQHQIARALIAAGDFRSDASLLHRGIAAARETLLVEGARERKADWAERQNRLAIGLALAGQLERRRELMQQAAEAFALSADAYRELDQPANWVKLKRRAGRYLVDYASTTRTVDTCGGAQAAIAGIYEAPLPGVEPREIAAAAIEAARIDRVCGAFVEGVELYRSGLARLEAGAGSAAAGGPALAAHIAHVRSHLLRSMRRKEPASVTLGEVVAAFERQHAAAIASGNDTVRTDAADGLAELMLDVDAEQPSVERLERALADGLSALKSVDRAASPIYYGRLSFHTAEMRRRLGERRRDPAVLRAAVDGFDAAADLFRRDTERRIWALAMLRSARAALVIAEIEADRAMLGFAGYRAFRASMAFENVGTAEEIADAAALIRRIGDLLSQ